MNAAGGRETLARVLVADDDIALSGEIVDFLGRYEFRCLTAANWDETLQTITRDHPDAIILDQWLGDVDTLPRLPQIRQLFSGPLLILTTNQEIPDRVLGLELGADDFLCKPVSGRELVARVRAQLRGRQHPPPSPVKPAWTLDGASGYPRRSDGHTVHLTTAEVTLLSLLMEKPGEVRSRETLTQAVFNRAWRAGDRAVDTIIVNLRGKLDRPASGGEAVESCIITIRNAGYKFVKPTE